MAQLTELQTLLTRLLKTLNLDKAAILFIVLTLKSESALSAMFLFIRDNPKASQEELMQVAVDLQELSLEMSL